MASAALAFFISSVLVLLATGSTARPHAYRRTEMASNVSSPSTAAAAAAPHFVVYSDQWIAGSTGPPDVSDVLGYNVFVLSFWLTTGPADNAEQWVELDNTTRAAIKQEYNNAGIKLMVSAFGSTQEPTTEGADPTQTAAAIAAFVQQYDLDGVDIDYEDFAAMDRMDGTAENWLIAFMTALRAQLPVGQYIVTHAPVAPWFSPVFTSGAYMAVDESVGELIDWYNVQFYNQGVTEYTTCDGLLNNSSSLWPQSALFQIAESGIPLEKLVIGKPAGPADATNGYMDPTYLATCLLNATSCGWDAGVMFWEYPTADTAWITSVRQFAFPMQ